MRLSNNGRPAASWLGAVLSVARRPDLWLTALGQVFRLAPKGWWRRWPPVPMPAPDYLRFRTLTAYGDPSHPPVARDLVTWLEWSKAWGALVNRRTRLPVAR